jgi:hypothetical protein
MSFSFFTPSSLNLGGDGFNGGGTAWGPSANSGGGGASDIRHGGTGLGNRIIVAGGGGGYYNLDEGCTTVGCIKGGDGGRIGDRGTASHPGIHSNSTNLNFFLLNDFCFRWTRWNAFFRRCCSRML